MSTFYLYLFSKGSDEVGFAQRAFEILKAQGFATAIEGDEVLFNEEHEQAMLLSGQGGNWIRTSEIPVAIPEESHSYVGLCPKCESPLGEDFDVYWNASLHPELYEMDEAPLKPDPLQVACPACGWTGNLEQCRLDGENFSIRLRSEYIGIYDIYDPDVLDWKSRLEALVPDSEVIISVD